MERLQSLTSNEENIQKKLLLKAKLPVNPVHMPSRPCTRMTCRAQSIGPLNWRSVRALWSWSCSFTAEGRNLKCV